MATTETLTLYGSAVLDDIEGGGGASRTFTINGKKVKELTKSDKKIKEITLDSKKIFAVGQGIPMADVVRRLDSTGLTLTGSATVGDTDGTVVYGDVKRVADSSGVTITGSAVLDDTDGTLVKGDTVRINTAFTDYNGYIKFADHSLFINSTTDFTNVTNRIAVFDCEPSTTYTITMNMYSRFRVCSYAGVPASGTVMTNYIFDSLDDNSTTSQNGAKRTLTFTTGASDTKIFIGYWTIADTVSSSVIRYGLFVDKYINWTGITQGYYINSSGTLVADASWCVTDYIPITNSTSVKWAMGTTNGSSCICEYLSDKSYEDYWTAYVNPKTITLTGGVNTAYVRVSFYMPNMSNCYLLDVTNNKYLWKAG